MKKLLCLAAAAALLLSVAACGANGGKDTLTGSPEELLARLKEAVTVELPMSFDSEVTAESAQSALGLTEAQFAEFVESAYESQAAITTIAQSTVLIKCKSVADASEVKKLIAGGYDSRKWICVFPQQSVVVESGSYVLLAVGKVEATDALVEAFRSISEGNTGSPDVFFTSEGEPEGGDGDLVLF